LQATRLAAAIAELLSLKKRGLEVERIVPWLREYGGYCDCEVIYNVDDTFGEIVGR
jgi:hypothetical protein